MSVFSEQQAAVVSLACGLARPGRPMSGACEICGAVCDPRRNDANRQASEMVARGDPKKSSGINRLVMRHGALPVTSARLTALTETGQEYARLGDPGDVRETKCFLKVATGMAPAGYEKRAADNRAELLAQLQPMVVYLERYRAIIGG